MTKRAAAKHKFSRRIRKNLWGQPGSPVIAREYGPGQHGQRRNKKSDYGSQLEAKQTLRNYYGNILERQFRKIYQEASRRKGDTQDNLIELLERRLDAVVYRAKFAPTVFSARQLVSHGHIAVNGKRVTISSFMVKDNDEISLIGKIKDTVLVQTAIQAADRDVPDYVSADHGAYKAKFVRGPKLADVPYPVQMEPNLVVEFYSR
ncbi:MAG: 30S ribosomal protein S4 [Dongiaceae bacterium]